MRAEDVTHTSERSCRPQAAIRPVSGTNPGSCRTTAAAVVADLVDGLDERKSAHIRGAPGQPQTQGKIERWHQTLKNPIRLENYDLPGDLDAQIKASVERYTHRRDHESIDHRIRPTSISAVAKPSGSSGNAATARPSTSVVGFTASKPHKISPPDEPQPPLSQAAIRPKCVDDGSRP
jgi:putative transposase